MRVISERFGKRLSRRILTHGRDGGPLTAAAPNGIRTWYPQSPESREVELRVPGKDRGGQSTTVVVILDDADAHELCNYLVDLFDADAVRDTR